MTAKQLNEIKARAEAATPGPWSHNQTFGGQHYIGETRDDDAPLAFMHQGFSEQVRNAEFIAHSRTDIPALLQEIERLQAKNAEIDKSPAPTAVITARSRWAGK